MKRLVLTFLSMSCVLFTSCDLLFMPSAAPVYDPDAVESVLTIRRDPEIECLIDGEDVEWSDTVPQPSFVYRQPTPFTVNVRCVSVREEPAAVYYTVQFGSTTVPATRHGAGLNIHVDRADVFVTFTLGNA